MHANVLHSVALLEHMRSVDEYKQLAVMHIEVDCLRSKHSRSVPTYACVLLRINTVSVSVWCA
jgi:hypothetical protein